MTVNFIKTTFILSFITVASSFAGGIFVDEFSNSSSGGSPSTSIDTANWMPYTFNSETGSNFGKSSEFTLENGKLKLNLSIASQIDSTSRVVIFNSSYYSQDNVFYSSRVKFPDDQKISIQVIGIGQEGDPSNGYNPSVLAEFTYCKGTSIFGTDTISLDFRGNLSDAFHTIAIKKSGETATLFIDNSEISTISVTELTPNSYTFAIKLETAGVYTNLQNLLVDRVDIYQDPYDVTKITTVSKLVQSNIKAVLKNGSISINGLGNSHTKIAAKLYDSRGRVVKSISTMSSGNSALMKVGSLSSGVYVLQVKTKNGISVEVPVISQR